MYFIGCVDGIFLYSIVFVGFYSFESDFFFFFCIIVFAVIYGFGFEVVKK